MKIYKVKISNFKAIQVAELELGPHLNVFVGANGSGKSSVLQSLHWALQSGRHPKVEPGKPSEDPSVRDKASTLSARDAIYIPSPSPGRAGHGDPYGNAKNQPQLTLELHAEMPIGSPEGDEGSHEIQSVSAVIWLKSAKNEGVSVHIPSNNALTRVIRGDREISAYIPGLAGIPLSEEKRSSLVVKRQAAAGDSNTVLRNILVLLRDMDSRDGTQYLFRVVTAVARVMDGFEMKVEFEDDRNLDIEVTFRTSPTGNWIPLELAGIGYLQILQIFAYLVYFRPRLLLVDEPDAHLYPIAQERLVSVLYEAAEEFDSQVLLTTHSPSIVRALPDMAKIIWMNAGSPVTAEGQDVRNQMGWGLLDKNIVLMTEDADTGMLVSLLSQWPHLHRRVAIWPMKGSSNLPSPEVLTGLGSLLGDDVRIILHRDADFLSDEERQIVQDEYTESGNTMWITRLSDMESYWCDVEVIRNHYGITLEQAESILERATETCRQEDKHLQKISVKRQDLRNKLLRNKRVLNRGDEEIAQQYESKAPGGSILGKDLVSAIRSAAAEEGISSQVTFGKAVPSGASGSVAVDLKQCIEGVIGAAS